MIPVEKPWEMPSLCSLSCAVYLSPRLLVSSLMNPAQLMNTFGPMWQSWTSWVRFSRRLLFCFKICLTQERRHWSALLLHYTHWEEKTESKDNLSTGKQTESHLSQQAADMRWGLPRMEKVNTETWKGPSKLTQGPFLCSMELEDVLCHLLT